MSIDAIRDELASRGPAFTGYPAITADQARAAVAQFDALLARHRVSNQEVLDAVNEIAQPLIDGLEAERDEAVAAAESLLDTLREIEAAADGKSDEMTVEVARFALAHQRIEIDRMRREHSQAVEAIAAQRDEAAPPEPWTSDLLAMCDEVEGLREDVEHLRGVEDAAMEAAFTLQGERDAAQARIANLHRLLARAHRDISEARDELFLASIAKLGLHAQLHWHEQRHGTRAEQEAEEAAFQAESERLDTMTPEEQDDLLRADGIDPEEVSTRTRWWIDQCLHRAIRWREMVEARDAAIARAEDAEAQRDALREAVRCLAGCRDDDYSSECESCALLADTQAVADARDARLRAEERERCSSLAFRLNGGVIADAIEALD